LYAKAPEGAPILLLVVVVLGCFPDGDGCLVKEGSGKRPRTKDDDEEED
jgi:hypothetical protein